MQQFSTFDVDELKLVYRVLHQNLMAHIERWMRISYKIYNAGCSTVQGKMV